MLKMSLKGRHVITGMSVSLPMYLCCCVSICNRLNISSAAYLETEHHCLQFSKKTCELTIVCFCEHFIQTLFVIVFLLMWHALSDCCRWFQCFKLEKCFSQSLLRFSISVDYFWGLWKWRTWKWRTIKIARHEIAGHEIDGPTCRAWNCRTWKGRTWNCKTWNCKTWPEFIAFCSILVFSCIVMLTLQQWNCVTW